MIGCWLTDPAVTPIPFNTLNRFLSIFYTIYIFYVLLCPSVLQVLHLDAFTFKEMGQKSAASGQCQGAF